MNAATPEPTGAYLRDLLGVDFTPEQLAIVGHPLCPQLVVAGAGSGKTAVMAARVVHAVACHGLPPAHILGLTFTNKAADQLAERVRAALAALEAGRPSAPVGGEPGFDELPTITTYHAYAAGLVREHALRIGREPGSRLVTEGARWQLALRVVRGASGPFSYLSWTPAYVARYLLTLDAEMSDHLRSPAEVRAFDAELLARFAAIPDPAADLRKCATATGARDELLTLVEEFRARKRQLDLIDYGDQVGLAAEIVRRSVDVRRIERDRHRLVLLDEYQDTGVAQRLLLTGLYDGGHPVTAVGDPNQAIYGWRGASVGNLLRFPAHFAGEQIGAGEQPSTGEQIRAGEQPSTGEQIRAGEQPSTGEQIRGGGQPSTGEQTRGGAQPLMTSFRCGGRILAVAAEIADRLRGSPAARRRPPLQVPPLRARAGHDDAGDTLIALLHTVADEASWVADAIASAVRDDDVPPGEVGVLCRRARDFSLLHAALIERGLPVEVVGLGGLLEMPEVADVVATLRVLVDPTAGGALVRLLTGPRWRFGPRDLAALGRRAAALGRVDAPVDDTGEPVADGEAALREAADQVDPADVVSLLDAVDHPGHPDTYSPAAYDRLGQLRAELRQLRPLVDRPLMEAVTEVVAHIGLDVEIEAQPAPVARARAANLAAFFDHAAHFVGLDGGSDLTSFLDYLDAAAEQEGGLDVGGVSTADSVKLLTVHKAKGLEWDVVAVPGLSEGVFPNSRGRSTWPDTGYLLPTALRGDAADLPAWPELTGAGLKAFKADCRADDADEERRLGYVAATRARRRLLLSGYWWGATQLKPKGPSVLLTDAHTLAQQGLATIEQWADKPAADATNPLLARLRAEVDWPAAYQPDRFAARLAAADAVRRAQRGESAGAGEPDAHDRGIASRWRAEGELLIAELVQVRGGVREVVLPRQLTASQVVALAEDEQAFARGLVRPLPRRPQAASRRGSRFHAWAESYYGERPLLEPDDVPGAGDADLTDAELAALQQAFLATPYAGRRPVAVEAAFELVVGGRVLRGRIDAVYPTDNGYEVIDYKTGEVPRDFAAASLQLSVYRLAWAGIAGVDLRRDPQRVRAGFLYIRRGQVKRPARLLDAEELAVVLAGSADAEQGVSQRGAGQ